MFEVICHTNLDLFQESWPTELPCLPPVGTRIISKTKHKGGVSPFQLELEVISIRFIYSSTKLIWMPHVELHMTSWQKLLIPSENAKKQGAVVGSITAFYEWYAPKVGKNVSYFL